MSITFYRPGSVPKWLLSKGAWGDWDKFPYTEVKPKKANKKVSKKPKIK